jgi:hypothetical protein
MNIGIEIGPNLTAVLHGVIGVTTTYAAIHARRANTKSRKILNILNGKTEGGEDAPSDPRPRA